MASNARHVLVKHTGGKAVEIPGLSTADGAKVARYTGHGGTNVRAKSGGLPLTFHWSSSGVFAGPKPPTQHPGTLAIEDFSVARYTNQWLIHATTAGAPSGGPAPD